MNKSNIVFIAQSLDGYISGRNGGLEWLHSVPNPEHIDMGYSDFIAGMDAIVMGRITFETVCSFDIDWPYEIPVFVLSTTLKAAGKEFHDKAELMNGSPAEIVEKLNNRGYHRLYIDGGTTIQGFLKEDLINEIIISTLPVLLGGGSRLFSLLPGELKFEHVDTRVFLNEIVQSHYKRKR